MAKRGDEEMVQQLRERPCHSNRGYQFKDTKLPQRPVHIQCMHSGK